MKFKASYTVFEEKNPNSLQTVQFAADSWGEALKKSTNGSRLRPGYTLFKLERIE